MSEKALAQPVTYVEAATMPSSENNSLHNKDLENSGPKSLMSLRKYLFADVDPNWTTAPLAMYCFMTGYCNAVCFSAIFVWCGFQTGNFAQLALAVGRLFEGAPGDLTFHKADQQALCSLLGFNAGAFIGRLGDRVGPHKRAWLIFGTFIQTLFTMVCAITLWKSGQGSIANARDDPAWTNALTFVAVALMSASLGLQGILSKRLNRQFGTTIVLTTIWIELMCDPKLFRIRQYVVTRDHRLIAAFSLFLGAFIGRAILFELGSAATMGIGVGLRMIITFSWLFVPNKS
ncbi:unnamed protein product [Cyclocybe aegerita]|uniref:DUF1275 domain protein n=1 Tax=Cyclocybe aegerita TaxID=1973307 RepID=A0A8S0XY71_CYCAE|nr:unnamed protein product [Cyclocybe aegerita]